MGVFLHDLICKIKAIPAAVVVCACRKGGVLNDKRNSDAVSLCKIAFHNSADRAPLLCIKAAVFE